MDTSTYLKNPLMCQRYNPLPSCPPALLDSKVDAASREYFMNAAPGAWGPGTRAGATSRPAGLSRVLTEVAFDKFSVCDRGELLTIM